MKIFLLFLLLVSAVRGRTLRSGNEDRHLADFLEQAQEEKHSDELESLEENGDASGVDIVDNAQEEEQEEESMEEEAGELEAEQIQENPDMDFEMEVKNRRRFVSYEPSPWEQQWLDQIDNIMSSQSLCKSLLWPELEVNKMHDYLQLICSTRAEENWKWCYYEDRQHFMWYNSENHGKFDIYVNEMPPDVQVRPVYIPLEMDGDSSPGLASKFTFYDDFAEEEYEEYIEPLVSHLRFPLAGCLPAIPLLAEVANFVIPPNSLERTNGRKIIYDLGSKNWSRLEYIVEEWMARGINFTDVSTYATSTNEAHDDFPLTVPKEHQDHIYRHYFELVDSPNPDDDKVFLPTKIAEQAQVNDYILLKLDRANSKLKESIVQYILDHDIMVHELVWEINNVDNYVLEKYIEDHASFADISSIVLADTYRQILALRNKGIRAHAWI
jgi:hypothetical protein